MRQKLALDAETWYKGELLYPSSGLPAEVSTTAITTVMWMAAEDETTSLSSSNVWVREIPTGAKGLAFLINNGAAIAWSQGTHQGAILGAYGLSNVTHLDTATTDGQFHILGPASERLAIRSDYDASLDDSGSAMVEFEFLGQITD